MRLVAPARLDAQSAATLLSALESHDSSCPLELDFSGLTWVQPSGALPLALKLRSEIAICSSLGQGATVRADFEQRDGPIAYLKNIGFFRLSGFPTGKPPQDEVRESARSHIPITEVTRQRLLLGGRPVFDSIQESAEEISRIISLDCLHSPVHRIVAYAIREALRNVFEHSGALSAYILCQRWPVNGFAEITIADEGRGVPESLAEGGHEFSGPDEALALARSPGVSRVRSDTEENPNGNSGFGLYVLSEIGRKFGRFLLGSGHRYLTIARSGKQSGDWHLDGTCVVLRARLRDDDQDLTDLLAEIVRQGESEASATDSTWKRASRSSRS